MITGYIEFVTKSLDALGQGNVAALGALFTVLALGEFGVPFPYVLQGVLFFIGCQISQGAAQVIPILLMLALGRQFGSVIVYWLARLAGVPVLGWYGRHFRLLQGRLDRLKEKLSRQTPLAVAAGRLTPGLLMPTSILCGAMRLRYLHFALGVLLSAVVWDWTFISFGIISARGAEHLALTSHPWLIPAAGFAVASYLAWAASKLVLSARSGEQPATNLVGRTLGGRVIAGNEPSALGKEGNKAAGQLALYIALPVLGATTAKIGMAKGSAFHSRRDNIPFRYLRRLACSTWFFLAHGGCGWLANDISWGPVAYIPSGNTCIVIADPLCLAKDTVRLPESFRQRAGAHRHVVLPPVSGRLAPLLQETGYGAVGIVSDPFLDLNTWEPRSDHTRKTSFASNLTGRNGLTAKFCQPAQRRDLDLEKERLGYAREWPAIRLGFDTRFSSVVWPLALTGERHYFLAWRQGHTPGFLTSSLIYARDGWYAGGIVHAPGELYGIAELLVIPAFKSLREAGLSVAPLELSRLADPNSDRLHPGQARLIRAISFAVNRFFNLRDVCGCRDKFAPWWWKKVCYRFLAKPPDSRSQP